jgi:hypothetical protein
MNSEHNLYPEVRAIAHANAQKIGAAKRVLYDDNEVCNLPQPGYGQHTKRNICLNIHMINNRRRKWGIPSIRESGGLLWDVDENRNYVISQFNKFLDILRDDN